MIIKIKIVNINQSKKMKINNNKEFKDKIFKYRFKKMKTKKIYKKMKYSKKMKTNKIYKGMMYSKMIMKKYNIMIQSNKLKKIFK